MYLCAQTTNITCLCTHMWVLLALRWELVEGLQASNHMSWKGGNSGYRPRHEGNQQHMNHIWGRGKGDEGAKRGRTSASSPNRAWTTTHEHNTVYWRREEYVLNCCWLLLHVKIAFMLQINNHDEQLWRPCSECYHAIFSCHYSIRKSKPHLTIGQKVRIINNTTAPVRWNTFVGDTV